VQEAAIKEDKPVARGDGRDPGIKHPVGVVAGGVVGAAAAAAVAGSVAGPVGTVAGAVVGAAIGALGGTAFAALVDPDLEEAYWRQAHAADPARTREGLSYEQDYGPAYRYGVDAFSAHPDRHFNEMEAQLSEGWAQARGESRLDWEQARLPTLDASQRVRDLAQRKPE
jgi:hypothetical protein